MKKMNLFEAIKHNVTRKKGELSAKQLKEVAIERERLAKIDASQEVQQYYRCREALSKRFMDILEPIRTALETLDGRDHCKVTNKLLDLYWEYFQELSKAKDNLNKEQSAYIYKKGEFTEELIETEFSFRRNEGSNNTNDDMLGLIKFTEEVITKRYLTKVK